MCNPGKSLQTSGWMFHAFILGATMLGWHNVPTGFVPPFFWGGAEPVPKPVQHGKWVPDVNALIIIEQKYLRFVQRWTIAFIPGLLIVDLFQLL